eukprot:347453_1
MSKKIVIKQYAGWNRCHIVFTCSPMPSMRWRNSNTNQLFEQYGLTQDILDNEIRMLNRKANMIKGSECSCCWSWLILLLALIVGVIVLTALKSKVWIVMILFVDFGIAIFVWSHTLHWIATYQLKRWNQCLLAIQKYIDEELNVRYKDSDIIWRTKSIFKKFGHKKIGTGRYGTRRGQVTIKYFNIMISHKTLSNVALKDEEEPLVTINIQEELSTSEGMVRNETKQENYMNKCLKDGWYQFRCFETNKVIHVKGNSKRVGAVLEESDETSEEKQLFYISKIC